MATPDSIQNEIYQTRKAMNAISPKIVFYHTLKAKLEALEKTLEFIKANPPAPAPKGLLDFDEGYVPPFKPQHTRYQSHDNFEELQNLDRQVPREEQLEQIGKRWGGRNIGFRRYS